mgnify:CR=1 FL=1
MGRLVHEIEGIDVDNELRAESVPADRLTGLYRSFDDPELKKQVLYTVARRDEPAALDFLMDVDR